MDVRIFGIQPDSIVDGVGLRLAVFLQGCEHNCPGCHNPESHALDGGTITTTDALLDQLRSNMLQAGITLSGGEPLLQPKACLALAEGTRVLGKTVWLYTGFLWEDLLQKADPDVMALLRQINVLVDGPFMLAERTLELRYRGSRNQRVIDVPASLQQGELVPWKMPEW